MQAIMDREFGPVKTTLYRPPENRPATEEISIRPPRDKAIIVDGYNIIFAWEKLAELAKSDLDAARRRLCDILSSYAGFKKCRLVLVFDGYKVKGNPGEKENFHNIQVVYTKENQTADTFIEQLMHELGPNYNVRVVTGDRLLQISAVHSGISRVTASEFEAEIVAVGNEITEFIRRLARTQQ